MFLRFKYFYSDNEEFALNSDKIIRIEPAGEDGTTLHVEGLEDTINVKGSYEATLKELNSERRA